MATLMPMTREHQLSFEFSLILGRDSNTSISFSGYLRHIMIYDGGNINTATECLYCRFLIFIKIACSRNTNGHCFLGFVSSNKEYCLSCTTGSAFIDKSPIEED